MNKCIYLVCALSLLTVSCRQQAEACYEVVPLPHQIEVAADNGAFALDKSVTVVCEDSSEQVANYATMLKQYIKELSHIKVSENKGAEKTIVLATDYKHDNQEAYEIVVSSSKIVLNGASEAGLFYAMQTLRKSLPVGKYAEVIFPAASIKDEPRFSYRGMMLDVSRHFSTVEEVKRVLDVLALHNLNVFHWHLTDDQGWRIEIKKYPELTRVGAWREATIIGRPTGSEDFPRDGKKHGGFYTQEQIKEVIAYAAQRNITVIPEIDLPGHTQAVIAAYNQLSCTGDDYKVCERWGVIKEVICAGNDSSLILFKDVMTEVMEMFPAPYIHIGGDECVKSRWQACPKCQAKIKQLNLKGDKKHSAEDYLQSYFMSEVAKHIQANGKQVIGWDEILEGKAADGAVVMSWRGNAGGIEAARLGHRVIMAPTTNCYFDYSQTLNSEKEEIPVGGFINVERVYNFEPFPQELTEEECKLIFGVQANVWAEYMPQEKYRLYQIMPRIAALAEVQWCAPERKNFGEFLGRLPRLIADYEAYGYNYAKHLYGVSIADRPDTTTQKLRVSMSTMGNAPIYYTLDGSTPTKNSALYNYTLELTESAQVRAAALHNGKLSEMASLDVIAAKSSYKPVKLLSEISRLHIYGGAPTLVDGVVGSLRVDDGRWLAFLNGLELVIDMQQPTSISSVTIHNLTHQPDCIADPELLTVAISNDGINYTEVSKKQIEINHTQVVAHSIHNTQFEPCEARFVKVGVYTPKQPKDSPGYGNNYWLFISEILVD